LIKNKGIRRNVNNFADRESPKKIPERIKRVLEKASSKAFYVSLYLLLLVGFLSDDIIKFRDVSQATSLAVGLMAVLFAVFWTYYNKKEI